MSDYEELIKVGKNKILREYGAVTMLNAIDCFYDCTVESRLAVLAVLHDLCRDKKHAVYDCLIRLFIYKYHWC